MANSNAAAQVANNFMLQNHSFLLSSEKEINEYNLALLEEMKKKVTYEEYLAWGNDLGEVRPCEFRNGQCELFCEKFAECMGD